MGNNAIEISNVSKLYRLGEVGTGTISHDLNRWWHKLRGKDDPYLRLGEVNMRDVSGGDYVWAIKDVSFNVNQGEVLGIIGRNGAGKSTLLKLLSRVTAPTTGSIKAKGRIASLLEVGTGFHPELTGRENVYLNGAILGMTKKEIKSKFDEIVSFAGVERYIDTPVKRYSSGMYVRLAFGVAAHLESEILIIDEVLAVGDVDFQRKCLGKMNEVAKGEGRTVLFVSHNMAAVNSLCNNAVMMERGTVYKMGAASEMVAEYVRKNEQEISETYKKEYSEKSIYFKTIEPQDANMKRKSFFSIDDEIYIEFLIKNQGWDKDFSIGLSVNDSTDKRVMIDSFKVECDSSADELRVVAKLGTALLTPNLYTIDVAIEKIGNEVMDFAKNALKFEILRENTKYEYLTYDYGVINKGFDWKVIQ